MLMEKRWDSVSQHLLAGVDRLVKGGAHMLCIASNTGHIAVPAIEDKYVFFTIHLLSFSRA